MEMGGLQEDEPDLGPEGRPGGKGLQGRGVASLLLPDLKASGPRTLHEETEDLPRADGPGTISPEQCPGHGWRQLQARVGAGRSRGFWEHSVLLISVLDAPNGKQGWPCPCLSAVRGQWSHKVSDEAIRPHCISQSAPPNTISLKCLISPRTARPTGPGISLPISRGGSTLQR